jgi:hypothetical protein
MTFDGTCERGGVQRAPQEIEERSPVPIPTPPCPAPAPPGPLIRPGLRFAPRPAARCAFAFEDLSALRRHEQLKITQQLLMATYCILYYILHFLGLAAPNDMDWLLLDWPGDRRAASQYTGRLASLGLSNLYLLYRFGLYHH